MDDLTSDGGGFKRIERYTQDKVKRNDGFETSQEFLVFERLEIAGARLAIEPVKINPRS